MPTALLETSDEKSVILIDDDEDERDELNDSFKEANYTVHKLIGPYGNNLDQLLREIEQLNSPVLCDNRLGRYGLADFNGAQVVSNLYERKVPAILLTIYRDQDRLRLTEHKMKIPCVIERDRISAEAFEKAIALVQEELADNLPSDRIPHRVIVRPEDILQHEVEAVIPSWNPSKVVSIPRTIVDDELLDRWKENRELRFLANVNIGSQSADDLYFTDFTMAPSGKE